jgi:hypothetical protein
MTTAGDALLVRIYSGESDTHDGRRGLTRR